jgi:hypothetical protein
MANGPPDYTLDPTRIRTTGEASVEGTVVSASITDTGVQITVRSGSISSRDVTLTYDEIVTVETVEELSHSLVIGAGGTEYVLMNVTIDEDRILELANAVKQGVRQARTPGSGSERSESTRSGGSEPAPDGEGGTGERRDSTETTSADGSPQSAADELKKWVELHEQGVITDEELEQKKQELL